MAGVRSWASAPESHGCATRQRSAAFRAGVGGWGAPPRAVRRVGLEPFDKRGSSRFINTVTLVRRQLARALLGLSALSAPPAAAQASGGLSTPSVAPTAAVLSATEARPPLGANRTEPASPVPFLPGAARHTLTLTP